MDEDVRRVMEDKNLLLFREVMADAGVVDQDLFSDMCQGFRLTGELKALRRFPDSFRLEQLKSTAKWAKYLVQASCKKASRDPQVAAVVWQETAEQVSEGWLKGPLSWQEVEEKYKGVPQNDKVRAVDDNYQ